MVNSALKIDDYRPVRTGIPVFHLVPLSTQRVSSYEEYAKIEERVEVFEGEVYAMASPTSIHQMVTLKITNLLSNQLAGKPCIPFVSPMDVELFPAEAGKKPTIVQPDFFIVCDKDKVKPEGHIMGAPDFILEVLSPSSYERDLIKKSALYAKAGVKEYWALKPGGVEEPWELTICLYDEVSQSYDDITRMEAAGVVKLRTKDLEVDFDEVKTALSAIA
jgi:Uma2 family endonuclease